MIALLIGVFCVSDVLAQNSKKKKQNEEAQLREAEFYFTEGQKYFILEDYAKALALFQKSLEINPDNATLHYKIAQIHHEADELDKAQISIDKALSLEENNKYFYVLAADIYTQKGDFGNASKRLETLTNTIDNTDQYLFELAAIYLYQQRFDDAIRTYGKIEAAYGISEEVISQKQKIYLRTNNIEKAIEEGEKLINTFPENPQYRLKQAEIYIANDRSDQAVEFLEDFLKENESPEARLVLSDLQMQNGEQDKALENLMIAFEAPSLSINNKVQLLAELRSQMNTEDLRSISIELSKKLIEVHPEEADSYAVYGDIQYASGNKEEAKNAYKKALLLDESNFNIWQNVIQIMAELNKTDSVIILSNQALEIYPNQGFLYYYNGSANLQKGQYQKATFALEQGKKLSTSNLGLVNAFNLMLGDAYNGTKEFEKSDRAFDAALEYDPDNYGALNNYSYYLALRKENLEKAEKMSAKTVKDNPNNATFIDTYAWVLFMREKYKEAKKVMEKAFESGNVSAIHYEHYGDILYKLGDVEGAVEQWQKAKGLNPDAELIDKKISDRKLYE